MDQILLIKEKALRRGKEEVWGGDEESEGRGGKEKVEAGKGIGGEGGYLSEEEFITVKRD